METTKDTKSSIQRTMEKKGLFIKFEELTTMAQTLIFPYSFSIFFHYPFSLTCNLYVDRKSRTLTTKGNGKLHGQIIQVYLGSLYNLIYVTDFPTY